MPTEASLRMSGERVGRIEGQGSTRLGRSPEGWRPAPDAPVNAKLVAEHTNLEALAPWLGPDARIGGRLVAVPDIAELPAEIGAGATFQARCVVAERLAEPRILAGFPPADTGF